MVEAANSYQVVAQILNAADLLTLHGILSESLFQIIVHKSEQVNKAPTSSREKVLVIYSIVICQSIMSREVTSFSLSLVL